MSILDFFSSTTNNNTQTAEKTNYVGFSGGPTYGLGFTYKKLLDKYGFQISGLPYKSDTNSFYAGGGTTFITLNKGTYGSLFISLGVGAYRREYTYTNYIADEIVEEGKPLTPPREVKITEKNGGFAAGPAIGMEFNFAENFTFSIELPMAFIFTFLNDDIKSTKFTSILPIPNLSLLYRF
jgi:hypothetical protein